MHQDNEQKIRRPSHDGDQTFESHPEKIDVNEFGHWIMKRDRSVFAMLEEYDRRKKRTQAETDQSSS